MVPIYSLDSVSHNMTHTHTQTLEARDSNLFAILHYVAMETGVS